MTSSVWEAVGLTEAEYRKIGEYLGRDPNALELGIYGLMWSEHCSYKSSKRHLETLPTEGPQVLQGPGENAGVVDIGEDIAVAFRIESHNHPSAIEPVQGAATGVGGILRDIFAMGAQPIALLDSLRFGNLDTPRVRYLFEGVVEGISWYGNCVGVPTVGGEIYFDDAYRDNPLVNVMCLGLVEKDRLVLGKAAGTGNSVLLVGAPTGRDGIHGASLLASREFLEEPEDMRPAVQVGDPFREKLLIEASLELLQGDAVIGINDLGAAGLASACSETATRGGSGMSLDLDQVPRREEGMTPYEVMLSESQERMLVIVEAGREAEVYRVFEKWGLDAVQIGEVTDDGALSVYHQGQEVARIPVTSLTEGAPVYDRPMGEPLMVRETVSEDVLPPPDYNEALLTLVGDPNLCSRRWVYEQYDHMVGINTVVYPGSDAAVLRVKGTQKGIAAVTDGNGLLCHVDPYRGAARVVAESYRNLSATGALPLAITNCLNFGNPERPEIMATFSDVIRGMGDACRALNTPVTGGNVSFYNETQRRSVYPTPVVGMIGVLDDVNKYGKTGFTTLDNPVVLLGDLGTHLGASQYLRVTQNQIVGPVSEPNYELERRMGTVCREGIRRGWIASTHDISDGGLGVALAESAALSSEQLGANIALPNDPRPDVSLFSEAGTAILVEVFSADIEEFLERARAMGCPAQPIGQVIPAELLISHKDFGLLVNLPISKIRQSWEEGLQ